MSVVPSVGIGEIVIPGMLDCANTVAPKITAEHKVKIFFIIVFFVVNKLNLVSY
jgi:hypothetical protein